MQIAFSILRGEVGSGDLTRGETDHWNVDKSFTRDVISLQFNKKKLKNLSPQGNCSFVYKRLLLCGSTSLWHCILALFAEEIPDCRDHQILHSDSKSTGCQ